MRDGQIYLTQATFSIPAVQPENLKGVQRDTGGYTVALAASMPHIFNAKAGQTFFLHQRYWLGGWAQLHHLCTIDCWNGNHTV